jgi:hypothetical protein
MRIIILHERPAHFKNIKNVSIAIIQSRSFSSYIFIKWLKLLLWLSLLLRSFEAHEAFASTDFVENWAQIPAG